MKLDGTYTFDAPREEVWAALLDPGVLAEILPGCERLEKVAENRYEAALMIRVGPVQGACEGKVELEDIRHLDGYTMKVDGQGAPGFVNATAPVVLIDQGEKTQMTYDADAKVGGRIASVGQRLLDSSAKAIVRQSLEGLNAVLVARSSAGAEAGAEGVSGAPSPTTAPSQTGFAAKVAQEVVKDLVPRPVRWGLGVTVVLLVLWLLWQIFS